MSVVLCRFGDNLPAVVKLATPEGCACFPEDREQALCAQHVIKWGIIGECHVLEIYDPVLAKKLGIEAES